MRAVHNRLARGLPLGSDGQHKSDLPIASITLIRLHWRSVPHATEQLGSSPALVTSLTAHAGIDTPGEVLALSFPSQQE